MPDAPKLFPPIAVLQCAGIPTAIRRPMQNRVSKKFNAPIKFCNLKVRFAMCAHCGTK